MDRDTIHFHRQCKYIYTFMRVYNVHCTCIFSSHPTAWAGDEGIRMRPNKSFLNNWMSCVFHGINKTYHFKSLINENLIER